MIHQKHKTKLEVDNILDASHLPVEPPCLHLVLDLLQQLVTFKICFFTSSFYDLQEPSLTETRGKLIRDVRSKQSSRTDAVPPTHPKRIVEHYSGPLRGLNPLKVDDLM